MYCNDVRYYDVVKYCNMVKYHAIVKYYNVVEYYALLTKICCMSHSRDNLDNFDYNNCPSQDDQSVEPGDCRMNMDTFLEI